MVYDSIETLMDIHGKLVVDEMTEKKLLHYDVDSQGIEDGKRYLVIPEGIEEIDDFAFSEYNEGELVVFVQNLLIDPDKAREEWQRKLRGQRAIKVSFPSEVGKSWFRKAEYMRKKELRVRFLRLSLPKSLNKVSAFALPDLLEAYIVNEENEYFSSLEGVLYSKDMRKLIRYPGFRDEKYDFTIPDSVEVIEKQAFKKSFIGKLEIPESVINIEKGAFDDCVIDELILPDNMEIIEAGLFVNCDIRKLVMPKNLRAIRDYAFYKTAGISEIVCSADSPEFGRGIFAEGYFRTVEWWPWKEIPEACFANSHIKHITVPEGVTDIGEGAFAGCYKAKDIALPKSVVTIGKTSFDEGQTYSGSITIPESLYKYVYRFPALSKVNKMKKNQIWVKRAEKDFVEDGDVLEKQRIAMTNYVNKIGIMQFAQKIDYKKQINCISNLKKESVTSNGLAAEG